jgi:hypothetical protein
MFDGALCCEAIRAPVFQCRRLARLMSYYKAVRLQMRNARLRGVFNEKRSRLRRVFFSFYST